MEHTLEYLSNRAIKTWDADWPTRPKVYFVKLNCIYFGAHHYLCKKYVSIEY